MLLKCYLLHIGIILARHVVFSIFVSMSTSRSVYVVFMWSIFHYLFFIFITINHIISLKQINLFFGHFCQKYNLRVLISFCLLFSNFSLLLFTKVLIIKKSVQPSRKKPPGSFWCTFFNRNNGQIGKNHSNLVPEYCHTPGTQEHVLWCAALFYY